MSLPAPPAQAAVTYGGGAYWDNRYEDRTCNFDWFFTYQAVGTLIRQVLGPARGLPCLHVGCGNSTIQEGMVEDGWVDVVNVDISSVVIHQMQIQHGAFPALHYQVVDCRSMHQFQDQTFGSIVDKGTLDAVACAPGGSHDVLQYLKEVERVLKPGGVFLLVSLGAPTARQSVVKGPPGSEWTTQVLLLPKPTMYLASEASLAGRVYESKRAACSKDDPIDVLGPFTPEEVEKVLIAGGCGHISRHQQPDYFFAYVCTKAGQLVTNIPNNDSVSLDDAPPITSPKRVPIQGALIIHARCAEVDTGPWLGPTSPVSTDSQDPVTVEASIHAEPDRVDQDGGEELCHKSSSR